MYPLHRPCCVLCVVRFAACDSCRDHRAREMLTAAERFGASSLQAEQADGEKTGRQAAVWSGDNCEMAVFGNTYSYITVSLMLLGWELSAPELAAANAAMRKLPAVEHGLAKDVRMTREDTMVRLSLLCSPPPYSLRLLSRRALQCPGVLKPSPYHGCFAGGAGTP